jgi:hypothetical protein
MSSAKSTPLLSKRQRGGSASDPIASLKKSIEKQHDLDQADAREHYTSQNQNKDSTTHSLLLEPYRSLGLYTSDKPFTVFKSDKDLLLATPIGSPAHSFYVYNTAKLNLVYMSRYIGQPILWLEAHPDGHIYTALEGGSLVKWNKMNVVTEYKGHTENISKFILSSELIFSLGVSGEFIIFNQKTGQVVQKKRFQ